MFGSNNNNENKSFSSSEDPAEQWDDPKQRFAVKPYYQCVWQFPSDNIKFMKFISSILDFIVCFGLIAVYYCTAALKMKRMGNEHKSVNSSSENESSPTQKRGLITKLFSKKSPNSTEKSNVGKRIDRAVQVIALCIFSFFIFNLPLQIIHIIQYMTIKNHNQLHEQENQIHFDMAQNESKIDNNTDITDVPKIDKIGNFTSNNLLGMIVNQTKIQTRKNDLQNLQDQKLKMHQSLKNMAAFHRIAIFFVGIHAVINPFIYALTSEVWKKRLYKSLSRIFQCFREKRGKDDNQVSSRNPTTTAGVSTDITRGSTRSTSFGGATGEKSYKINQSDQI